MKVGVVGCGYWGPNLVRNLIETNRCERVYGYDLDIRSMRALHRRFPMLELTESLEHLLDECDAVMVATPAASHYSIAKRALERHKSVFVEKPLASSSQQGAEMIALAEQLDLVLMVGHTFVYSPPVRKVREYLDRELLGKVYFLSSSRVNLGTHRNDVDVIWDLAPHDLSIFLYWLGETPVRVSAAGRACIGKLTDVASMRLEFPSGALANLEMSWLSPSKLRRTVVVGSKSMVVYDDTAVDKVKLYDRGVIQDSPNTYGEYQLTYRTGDVLSPNLDVTEPLFTQTNHFLDCVETGARPATDGRIGLDVVRVLEAASRSLAGNGEYVLIEKAEELAPSAVDGWRRAVAGV